MEQKTSQQITVEENHYRFIWGVLTIFSLLTGVVMFDPLQNSGSSLEEYSLIVFISALFTFGIWGIYKTIQPIYTVVLKIEDPYLNIHILFGEDSVKQYNIKLDSIKSITYQHRTPPAPDEALYDFSSDYIAVYQSQSNSNLKRLIDIDPEEMTLKLQDIGRIARFLHNNYPSIEVPEEDRPVLGV